MRSNLVVVSTPFLHFLAGVVKAQEPVLVQALGPELAVEGLDVRIVGGPAGPGEVQGHIPLIGPEIEVSGDELAAIVHPDHLRVGIWTPTTEALWRTYLAGVPVIVLGGGVVLQNRGYENLMITVTSEGSDELYRQRMPVPASMWQPWTNQGAEATLFHDAVVDLDGRRIAILLCYEQLLVWPVLHSALMQPDIVVATGNAWWTGSTNILPIQRAASVARTRLFNLPLTMAYNAPS